MIEKYGKNLDDIFGVKQSFIEDNYNLYKKEIEINKVAMKQKERKKCKNCDFELEKQIDFEKNLIGYKICNTCGHLNGIFEDTEEFAKAVYVEDSTQLYSKSFYFPATKQKWMERVKNIYCPKAAFLKKVTSSNIHTNDLIVDIGTGSGYFVKALIDEGYSNVLGYEVSNQQVRLANEMLGREQVILTEINQLKDIISETSAKVISMIGVLEHLVNPREILLAAKKNNNIKYIYISIPLISFSVFFELLKEDMFHRQLAGGHTHLYSQRSIEYFCNEFDFEIEGKWQFGADSMDLYRMLLLNLMEKGVSEKMIDLFIKEYKLVMNDVQLVFDKANFSSEVHLILKKKE